MRRRVPRRARVGRWGWAVLAIGLFLTAARVWRSRDVAAPEDLAAGSYRVERVVDGDTLALENGARVRLIGVDTPELHLSNGGPAEPFAREAAEFTQRWIGDEPVRLEFDRERLDKYGRFLAYVHVGDVCLNEELLRAGLGEAMLRFPYRQAMKTRFSRAQDEARRAARGIWKREPAADGR